MTAPRYTKAQLRAFAWLPSEGDWKYQAGLFSNCLQHMYAHTPYVDMEMCFGWPTKYRLTEPGIAEKKRLIEEGILGEQPSPAVKAKGEN